MFKIAYSGLKGRKRDTIINGLIIVLAIIFIMVCTTIFSSISATKRDNLRQTYGTWVQLGPVLKSQNGQVNNAFKGASTINVLGRNERFGLVGSIDDHFQKIANIKLIEGKYPESYNEVVLEYGQTVKFQNGIHIGDTIDMEVEIHLIKMNDIILDRELKRLFGQQYLNHMQAYISENPEEPVSLTISIFPTYYRQVVINNDVRNLSEDRQTAYLEKLSSVDYNELVNKSMTDYMTKALGTIYKTTDFNSSEYDGFKINLSRELHTYRLKPFVKSTLFSNPLDSEYKKTTSLAEEKVTIKIPVKVVGFIDDYNDNWTLNEQKLPNTLITDELFNDVVNAFYSDKKFDASRYTFRKFKISEIAFSPSERMLLRNTVNNTGYYKDGQVTQDGLEKEDRLLIVTILSVIFLTTLISVFKVNLYQIRRRVRRFGLLKAIGATKKQLAKILMFEVLIYLAMAMPIGLVVGGIISFSVVIGINHLSSLNLVFDMNSTWILLGSVLTILSFLMGMGYSFMKAIKAPFNAQMSMVPKRFKVDKKKTLYKPGMMLSFKRISLHQFRSHYKKNLSMFFLWTVVITSMFSAIIVAYVVYTPYMDDVIIKNIPDYTIELPYGMRTGVISKTIEKIKAVDGVIAVESLRSGSETYAKVKKMFEEAPFDQSVSINNRTFDNFKYTDVMKLARKIEAYGIFTEGSLFKKLKEESLGDDFDVNSFERGKTAILVLPRYKDNYFTTNFKYKTLYNEEYAVKKNGNITLISPYESIIDESINKNDAAVVMYYKIGGIVHGFDQLGVWPISNLGSVPVVLLSDEGFKKLYRKNGTTFNLEFDQIDTLRKVFYPSSLGKIIFTIDVDNSKNPEVMHAELRKISRELGVKTHDHILEKELAKRKALKLVIVVLIFGFSIATVALMIIFNLIQIKVENERERIGILQAIGVHKGQFTSLYRVLGILFGMFSFVLALLISSVITYVFIGSFNDIIKSNGGLMYHFPWIFAFVISCAYIILCAWIHYRPVARVIKNQPINNIQVNRN